MMGCWMPNSSVMRVFMRVLFLCGCGWWSIALAKKMDVVRQGNSCDGRSDEAERSRSGAGAARRQLTSAGYADALVDEHQHRGQFLRARASAPGLQAFLEDVLQLSEMTAGALREFVIDTGQLDHGVDQHAAPVSAFSRHRHRCRAHR